MFAAHPTPSVFYKLEFHFFFSGGGLHFHLKELDICEICIIQKYRREEIQRKDQKKSYKSKWTVIQNTMPMVFWSVNIP